MRKFLVLAASLLLACGVEDPSGLDEPLLVVGAQFVEGPLPGLPAGSEAEGLPSVFAFGWNNSVVLPGQAEKGIEGRVSAEAVAVAVRFQDLGSGYWVVPTGPEEPQYPGQRTYSLRATFPAGLPAGSHTIAVVALDADGKAGVQVERELCAAGPIPDNLHGCNPETAPPRMVVSLSWNVDADVDLQLVSSTGRVVTPEHPLLEPLEAGARPDARAARIDRDSLEGCIPDGLRRENFVIQDPLPSGTTLEVRAKLVDPCGHRSVAFQIEVHERQGEGDALRFVETFSVAGILHDHEAGRETGLHLARIRF